MKTQAIAGLIMLIFVMLTAALGELDGRRDGRPGGRPALPPPRAAEAAAAAVSSQPEDDAEATPSMPAFDRTDWRLRLVNANYELPADFAVETADVEGYLFDARARDALQSMLDGGRAAGVGPHPHLRLPYIRLPAGAFPEQGAARDGRAGHIAGGGEPIAAEEVARPGMSEHCLGLAVDIITSDYTTLDYGFAQTDAAKWLYEHCAEYGFILRYPEDKTDVTGIIYEPWHFRYVGEEAAAYIMENGLTLEEFLGVA